jgi:16S rRNA (guanine966-N2)-methyltransferase
MLAAGTPMAAALRLRSMSPPRAPRSEPSPRPDRGRAQRQLRIIGGRWRGRRFRFPPIELRPTPDRVRETLFNWLQAQLPGARCLDLYAGSGALGLEALSRGAACVVFVEQQRRAVQALEGLLREWQHEPGHEPPHAEAQVEAQVEAHAAGGPAPRPVWRVICGQALQFLAGHTTAAGATAGGALTHAPYDIVFLDPPFASGELAAAAATLERRGWLAPHARIYLEHARHTALPTLPVGWRELRAGQAGEVGYHLFTPATSADAAEGQP